MPVGSLHCVSEIYCNTEGKIWLILLKVARHSFGKLQLGSAKLQIDYEIVQLDNVPLSILKQFFHESLPDK